MKNKSTTPKIDPTGAKQRRMSPQYNGIKKSAVVNGHNNPSTFPSFDYNSYNQYIQK
jgi:hypothetical protein